MKDINKALIIEDEISVKEIVIEMLSILNPEVICQDFSDGTQGLAKGKEEKFDLIITDFIMPHITGEEIIASIRESGPNMETPVLVVTARAEEAYSRMESFGNIKIIDKPLTFEKLKKGLENLI